jgi:hypothetical protein
VGLGVVGCKVAGAPRWERPGGGGGGRYCYRCGPIWVCHRLHSSSRWGRAATKHPIGAPRGTRRSPGVGPATEATSAAVGPCCAIPGAGPDSWGAAVPVVRAGHGAGEAAAREMLGFDIPEEG